MCRRSHDPRWRGGEDALPDAFMGTALAQAVLFSLCLSLSLCVCLYIFLFFDMPLSSSTSCLVLVLLRKIPPVSLSTVAKPRRLVEETRLQMNKLGRGMGRIFQTTTTTLSRRRRVSTGPQREEEADTSTSQLYDAGKRGGGLFGRSLHENVTTSEPRTGEYRQILAIEGGTGRQINVQC